MQGLLAYETLIIELLFVATIVAIVVRRLRIPYTVALVLVGAVLATQRTSPLSLAPEIILLVLLPPLLFEAAFHLRLSELRRDALSVALLAIVGVTLTAALVGGALASFTTLAFPMALLFGALIAATDPVSVVALFRSLRVPQRLATLVEAESLMNDGTAVVLYTVLLSFALSGYLSVQAGLVTFGKVAAGGILIGAALGWFASLLIARIDDYLVETALTAVLAYGSYLAADSLGLSGVLAVVAAGLVVGSLGPEGMSPTTRIVLTNFWEFGAFLANSFVFLLIGLRVSLPLLAGDWYFVLVAILAVVIARFVVVYGLEGLANLFGARVPRRWQAVMSWGGLRGAVALALALSLPAALGEVSHVLQAMAFGVVLFTLLVQGMTMRPLLGALGLVVKDAGTSDYERAHARLMAMRTAAEHMQRLYDQGFISEPAWERVQPRLEEQAASLARPIRKMLTENPDLANEETDAALREFLRSQRVALEDLSRSGQVSRATYEALTADIDAELGALTEDRPEEPPTPEPEEPTENGTPAESKAGEPPPEKTPPEGNSGP